MKSDMDQTVSTESSREQFVHSTQPFWFSNNIKANHEGGSLHAVWSMKWLENVLLNYINVL